MKYVSSFCFVAFTFVSFSSNAMVPSDKCWPGSQSSWVYTPPGGTVNPADVPPPVNSEEEEVEIGEEIELVDITSPMNQVECAASGFRCSTPTEQISGAPGLQVTPASHCKDHRKREEGEMPFRRLLDEEKAAAQVTVGADGNLYFVNQKDPMRGQFIYFLDLKDRLFAMPVGLCNVDIFHTSFDFDLTEGNRSGECQMAGEMMVSPDLENRRVLINHDSGHYKPPFSRTVLTRRVLRTMGYNGRIVRTTAQW